MGDFRKNIPKTDFGENFLQGNTRPGEKKLILTLKKGSFMA